MKISNPKSKIECTECIQAKMTQTRNREPQERTEKPFDRVYIDLAGPVEPSALEDFKYALICVDDYSNLMSVYLLKKKGNGIDGFEKYLADIAPYGSVKSVKYMPGLLKCVRSDSG